MLNMNVKPIRNEADHKVAMTRIDELWDCAPGSPEGDELEVLAILVDAYEESIMPTGPSDPIEQLKFALDCHGLKPVDLADILGGRGRVSQILNRKRALTLNQIRKLSVNLKIPIELLTSQYELTSEAA